MPECAYKLDDYLYVDMTPKSGISPNNRLNKRQKAVLMRLAAKINDCYKEDGFLFKDGIDIEKMEDKSEALSKIIRTWYLTEFIAGLIPGATPTQRLEACKLLDGSIKGGRPKKVVEEETVPPNLDEIALDELNKAKINKSAPAKAVQAPDNAPLIE